MPDLNSDTVYCHLVDREDSDNLIVPGNITVTGTVSSGDSGDVVADSLVVDTDTLVVNTDSEVGFFGATPVTQQNVPTTSPTLADVIDALVALGLVEQSDL